MRWRSLLIPLVALQLLAPSVLAEEPSPAEKYFTNVVLVNQHGEEMRLYEDLLAEKVVVIDTIFTECTGVCPVLSKTFQRIQEHVGDRLGEDVHLISVSVDPATDTPERLAAFAESYDAKPGWYFLTGDEDNVDLALRKLGGYVERREAHNAMIIVGNLKTGLWKKALGMAPVDKILPIIDSVLHDEGGQPGR